MVSEEKSFESVDGRWTDDGRTTEAPHPISSLGTFGSGELKIHEQIFKLSNGNGVDGRTYGQTDGWTPEGIS